MIRRMIFLGIIVVLVLAACGTKGPAEVDRTSGQQDALQVAAPQAGSGKEAPREPVYRSPVENYSGDDLYDPALEDSGKTTQSTPKKALPSTGARNLFLMSGNYSGDDPYDPAAGGLSR